MKWLQALKAIFGLGGRWAAKEKAEAERDKEFAGELVSPEGVEQSRDAREKERRRLEEEGL